MPDFIEDIEVQEFDSEIFCNTPTEIVTIPKGLKQICFIDKGYGLDSDRDKTISIREIYVP